MAETLKIPLSCVYAIAMHIFPHNEGNTGKKTEEISDKHKPKISVDRKNAVLREVSGAKNQKE